MVSGAGAESIKLLKNLDMWAALTPVSSAKRLMDRSPFALSNSCANRSLLKVFLICYKIMDT